MAIAHFNRATVITPNLGGQGQSDGTNGDIDYPGQLKDDMEDLMAYSKNTPGVKKLYWQDIHQAADWF